LRLVAHQHRDHDGGQPTVHQAETPGGFQALFLEQGWAMPRGLVDSKARDPFNFDRTEWQQAKRAGTNPKALKAMFAELWASTRDSVGLTADLKARGYTLAQGGRRAVVAVDFRGEVYSLARYAGVKTKDVRERFGKTPDLPSVDEARADIAARMTKGLRALISEAETTMKRHTATMALRKTEMVQRHRQERRRLSEEQADRWIAETNARAARLPRGIKGIWSRLSGDYRRIRRLNETETEQGLLRDRAERQGLLDRQHVERRELQGDLDKLRRDHVRDLDRLHRDVAEYREMDGGREGIPAPKSRTASRSAAPTLGL